jgi:hypothetical protein
MNYESIMRIIIRLMIVRPIVLPSSLHAHVIFDAGKFSAAQIGKQLSADCHPSTLNQNLHQF